jgi:hypothetical protein
MHRRMFLGVVGLLALGCLAAPLPAQDNNRGSQPSPGAGQKWAILIGVDSYIDPNVIKLNYCGQDMGAIQERLLAAGFPADHIFLLRDGVEDRYLPFKSNIEKLFEVVLGKVNEKEELVSWGRAGKDDLVLIAFSGHGIVIDKTSYFCPKDTDTDRLDATLISLDRLYACLKACPAARKVLLVDACRNKLKRNLAKGIEDKTSAKGFSKSLEELRPQGRGIYMLSSCQEGQQSYEDPDLGHGVFMHFLLQGLDGKATPRGDGRITMKELYDYVHHNVSDHVHKKFNNPQTPVFQSPAFKGEIEGGDFEIGTIPTSAVVVTPPKPPSSSPPVARGAVRHGGIEIGSKGVKATVLEIIPGPRGDQNIDQKFSKSTNTTIVALKNGRFQEDAIDETAAAVETYFKQMQEEFQVKPERIYIVGSSGLLTEEGKPRAANQNELVKAVKERTGKTMVFIDVYHEIVMSLKGGVVPAKDRGSSSFIDIGSGNIKCGYYEEETKTTVERFVVVKDLPYGTKTYTDEVKKGAKAEDLEQFLTAAKAKQSLLTDPLGLNVERKPGLVNRQRVYLSGGAVWALASLVHPESAKETYVRLTAKDIDRFYDLLRKSPGQVPVIDLSKVDDANVRKAAEQDLKRVADTFTWQNLVAAAEILRAMAGTLRLNNEGKELLFARDGYMSWIVYYVQSSAETKTRP